VPYAPNFKPLPSPSALFVAASVLFAVAALPVSLNGADIIRFKGTVRRGESFQYKVRDGLVFGLAPKRDGDPCQGWGIWVGPSQEIETYASIVTTPFRHSLIDTDICASDFRNSDASGPNATGPKNVNRPQRVRQFSFVMDQGDYEAVEKAYDALKHRTLPTEQVSSEVSQLENVGKLKITRLSLGNLHVGAQPIVERLEFSVELDLRNTSGR
jgi:hypothetical protein